MAELEIKHTLVAAIIGGITGGLLVWVALPTSPPSAETIQGDGTVAAASAQTRPSDTQPSTPTTGNEHDANAARIQRLENMVARLQRRQAAQAKLDALEARGAHDSEGEPKKVTLNAADPRFEQAVRTVIDRAWEEFEQKRVDQRLDRRDRHVANKVDYLVDKLELTTDQQEKVDEIFLAQAETRRALFRSDDRPVTRKQWKDKMGAIRADTKRQLLELLSAQQKAAYEKLEQDEGFNAGWFGR